MANISGNSSGYSTQPTSMMQFSTKNEWMAQGADVWFPDSWKMEGFKNFFLPFLRKNFVNKLLLLFFFLKENHGLADSDSPCKLFLRGCVFVG